MRKGLARGVKKRFSIAPGGLPIQLTRAALLVSALLFLNYLRAKHVTESQVRCCGAYLCAQVRLRSTPKGCLLRMRGRVRLREQPRIAAWGNAAYLRGAISPKAGLKSVTLFSRWASGHD